MHVIAAASPISSHVKEVAEVTKVANDHRW
jgi:hypothetical protein